MTIALRILAFIGVAALVIEARYRLRCRRKPPYEIARLLHTQSAKDIRQAEVEHWR